MFSTIFEKFHGAYLPSFQDVISYICIPPVFGPTLKQIAARVYDHDKVVPTYFIAHIVVGLVAALTYLHGSQLAHNNLIPDHIILDPHPAEDDFAFRDYPNVKFINFGEASASELETNCDGDIRMLFYTLKTTFAEWTGEWAVAERQVVADLAAETKQELTVGELEELSAMAFDKRALGPEYLDKWLADCCHDDLVTASELDQVLSSDEWIALL
jgi:serine/threonine protein kinase